MKNMKKTLAWLILATMPMTGAAAETFALNRAAAPIESQAFERYPSWTCSDETGKWTVRANPADALLDRFWSYAADNSASVCVFSVEIEGNSRTGIWTPVLRFYYSGSRKLETSAVCILVDGIRYDFAAQSETVTHDRDTAEMISVPLTSDALEAVKAMLAADEVSVRLIGARTYTTELDLDATNTRTRIEAASLNTLTAAISLLNEAGISEYALWDLSAAAWKSEYGFTPAYASSAVVKKIGDISLTDDFGMVEYGDQTKAVKVAQQALIDAGFMSGSTASTFGNNSVNAAKRAQKFLGMIETGCMDAQLENALINGLPTETTVERQWQSAGDAVQLSLDRWWFADGVSAANAPDSVQIVYNADNVFLAADGMIRNISDADLKLFTGLKARVIYNDSASYDATVVCESGEGTALDVSMLPMAQSRIVVYAEVPGWLASQSDASWRIELTCGGETVEYTLQ